MIKFSHVVTPDTPKGRAALRFKQLAEEATKGRVKVEVYPNSQLYKDKEELEALQLGAVQMPAPSLSKFGPLGAKQFEIFDLPYFFQTESQFVQVTSGKFGQELFASLESKSIQGLAYWSGGVHVFAANKPLRKPAHLKGLMLRISSSQVPEASLRTVGALPKVMPFSEVYQAMQSGVVDGAVKQATEYEAQLVTQENADALAELRASGKSQVQDLTPAERDVWRKTLWPVHKEMEPRIGSALLKQVYQATGAAK